ncbi:hypothetical protein BT96DRAFT_469638 [Gymnopus androsaceus JB14]|uniref:Uncharacterized protein n=1 Tax=Gymnopus androsaceus JB14 TaxID=1447944 RepID=A0A6A4IPB5_9AGAR|nr:hypothetical protein BT96DRAFT_469638 [Gymnopus androsaceus JB14]
MPELYDQKVTIIWLHYISLMTSIFIAILSAFNGALSLYMNPLAGLLTIIFHVPLIILAHKRPEWKGMVSAEAAAFAYLLSLTWLVCLIMMVLVAWSSRVQLMGTSLEFGLLGDLAIRSTWARRAEWDDEKNETIQ